MIGICGASGLIGSALHRILCEKGYSVLGTYCHNYQPGLFKFDLRTDDPDLFKDCELVVITSAYKKIKFCEENILEAFWLNVFNTLRLIEYLTEKGIPALFISSDAAIKPELMETTYGKYKRIVEKYIKKKERKY